MHQLDTSTHTQDKYHTDGEAEAESEHGLLAKLCSTSENADRNTPKLNMKPEVYMHRKRELCEQQELLHTIQSSTHVNGNAPTPETNYFLAGVLLAQYHCQLLHHHKSCRLDVSTGFNDQWCQVLGVANTHGHLGRSGLVSLDILGVMCPRSGLLGGI